MKRSRQRKCRHCRELFRPDARNLRHQHYCGQAACRKASKAASQRRWLSKADNRDYFRGPANVQRVRGWRAAHPGYWRRYKNPSESALQADSLAQHTDVNEKSGLLVNTALQDLLSAQSVVLLGLIANLTGSVQQDHTARTGQRLQQLGRDILNGGLKPQGDVDAQTRVDACPPAPTPGTVRVNNPQSLLGPLARHHSSSHA